MLGCWAWAEVTYKHCTCTGWALVAPNGLAYLEQIIPFADCGRKVVACRRPPEKE